MDTSVSDLKGESSTYGVQCSWAHPLSGRIPGEFNSLLTKASGEAGGGGRMGWTAEGAGRRTAVPPMRPAFSEPQPGRAPQASLSDEAPANAVPGLQFLPLLT